MPRFAAIDVGSNASRLLIVSAKDPEVLRTVTSKRIPVRLGHSVFQTRRLDLNTIDESVAAMREFAELMESEEVTSYRALVTASARAAKNSDILLERVRDEAGISLKAIDGIEEARLVSLAIGAAMHVPEPGLLMDLGGGSLELSHLGSAEDFTVSLPIGTVRLLEAFLQHGQPVSDAQEKLLEDSLRRTLKPHRRDLKGGGWKTLVGSGGNLSCAARLCPADDQLGVPAIDIPDAVELLEELRHMPAAERAKKYSLRRDRADVIVPALYVITRVAKLLGVDRIEVPGVGLKEGIARELVSKHFRVWDYSKVDGDLAKAALLLGRRYHFDERHAEQVARLSLSIYDALAGVHDLGQKSRAILHLAALLHDIGDFVSDRSHHKHSQYIIENSDLMGLSSDDRRMVALVARYHRRAAPTPRHAAYAALSSGNRDRVKTLAAILRVADALDRGHQGKVQRMNVRVQRRMVTLDVTSERDLALENWSVERKTELFQNVFGRSVRIRVVSSGLEEE